MTKILKTTTLVLSAIFFHLLFTLSITQDTTAQEDTISPQTGGKPEVSVEVTGTTGTDKIKGGDGDDEIEGLEGDDTLDGGKGNDQLYGDEGNDLLKGNSGDDELYGQEGNDYLKGYQGNDKLSGDGGDDTLEGGAGVDELEGGPGADVFICDSEDIFIDFNLQENDTLSVSCKSARLLTYPTNSIS